MSDIYEDKAMRLERLRQAEKRLSNKHHYTVYRKGKPAWELRSEELPANKWIDIGSGVALALFAWISIVAMLSL